MNALAQRYRHCFARRRFSAEIALGLFLLLGSLVINFYAGLFASHHASNAVTDIILDNLPVMDVDGFFIYGPFILWLIVGILGLTKPQRMPFILQSIALFVLVRSGFVVLTHIGPFPDQIAIDYSSAFLHRFTFGGDLFFSAHTGTPFLMALVFWRERFWRLFFIGAAIFFGAVVLLAHLHYSIDVAAAFFITYSIYHLARYFFPTSWHWFETGIQTN